MSISSFLFRMARAVVQQVLGQLTSQLQIVQQLALAPMRMMIQTVTGGAWIGEGANAFVQEVSTLMIPGVGKVGSQITFMSQSLNKAIDTMDQADAKVKSIAQNIGGIFGGIFSG